VGRRGGGGGEVVKEGGECEGVEEEVLSKGE